MGQIHVVPEPSPEPPSSGARIDPYSRTWPCRPDADPCDVPGTDSDSHPWFEAVSYRSPGRLLEPHEVIRAPRISRTIPPPPRKPELSDRELGREALSWVALGFSIFALIASLLAR